MQAGVGTLQPTRWTDRSPDAVGDGDRDLHQWVNMEQIINYAQDERETDREKEGETQSGRQESWSDLSDILYWKVFALPVDFLKSERNNNPIVFFLHLSICPFCLFSRRSFVFFSPRLMQATCSPCALSQANTSRNGLSRIENGDKQFDLPLQLCFVIGTIIRNWVVSSLLMTIYLRKLENIVWECENIHFFR